MEIFLLREETLLPAPACHERAQRAEWSQRDASRTRNCVFERILRIACQFGIEPVDFSDRVCEVTQRLYEQGSQDKTGVTPLMIAAASGSGATVKILLAAGADPAIATPDGETALHSAAFSDSVESAAMLIAAKVPIDARMKDGSTPLHLAAAKGNKATVQLLLDNKADINAKAADGSTPLALAIGQRHKEVADLLRQHSAQNK